MTREEWLKDQCNKLSHGHCETRACFIRGGWKPGMDYDEALKTATCHALDCYKDIQQIQQLTAERDMWENNFLQSDETTDAVNVLLIKASDERDAVRQEHESLKHRIEALVDKYDNFRHSNIGIQYRFREFTKELRAAYNRKDHVRSDSHGGSKAALGLRS